MPLLAELFVLGAAAGLAIALFFAFTNGPWHRIYWLALERRHRAARACAAQLSSAVGADEESQASFRDLDGEGEIAEVVRREVAGRGGERVVGVRPAGPERDAALLVGEDEGERRV